MMQNFFKAGNQYFFNQNGKVKMGTLQYCEECGKPCNVNSVTITQAPSKLIAKRYNSDMNESEEMYYNEEKHLSLCDECY
jgi:hypothetical protein